VYELRSLVLNRFYDFRMTVTGGADCNAGIAVEKNIAVDIFNPNAFTTFGYELPTWSRVRWSNKLSVLIDDLLALWAW
jgi:hypothetical protein